MATSKRVKARINATVKLHEQYIHPLWERMLELYTGDHYPDDWSDQERVTVNVSFAVINVITPAVSHNFPKITVTPLREEFSDSAKIAEHALNAEWRKLRAQREVQQAVKDGLIFGTGWVKWGWRRIVRDKPRKKKDIESEFQNAKQKRDDKAEQYDAAGEIEQKDKLPTDKQLYESIPTTEPQVTNDEIFVERANLFDVFVDPECSDLEDAKFLIHRVRKPFEEVKANSKYDKKVLKDLTPDTRAGEYDSLPETQKRFFGDKELKQDISRVTLYEYWDLHEGTFAVYAEGADDPLLGPKAWPYEHLPFAVFRDNDVPNEFYGIGELEAVESLQRELNKTRSQMLNQRRQFNRKVIVNESAFYPGDIDEIRADKDGVVIPIRSNIPIEQSFRVIEPPHIDAQLYQVDSTIKRDITEITSVSEYQRGMLPEVRRTATEASLIESAASIRAQNKLGQVEALMAEVAHGILRLMQQFYTEEHVVRAAGEDGREKWFALEEGFLDGEFDVQVQAGSTQPRNESVRKAEANELFGMLVGHPEIDQRALLKWFLRQHNITGADKLLAQQQPAMPQGPPGMPGGPPGPPAEAGPQPEDEGVADAGLQNLLAQLQGQGAPVDPLMQALQG